jgi:tight adherence protein B
MGAMLGLLAGLGLLLIWRSGPRALRPSARRASWSNWSRRREEMIRQAGVGGVSSAQLLFIQMLAATLALVIVQC